MKEDLEKYFDRLWPICRSLTGDGVRETLEILKELVPLEIHEIPSGTQVYDWTIPNEWNIRDAYILTPDGRKIASLHENNLHVVSYSVPVNREMSYEELAGKLHYLPEQPNAIPYITSYYKEDWGFCLTYEEYQKLPKEGSYKVVIDSTLAPGSLTYGDIVLPGESDEEILFSTYVCHPSMANNELSGPLVAAFLYQEIAKLPKRKFTYRFVFAPETIGIIAYLNRVGEHLKSKLHAGYVLTCCGDEAPFVYKKSKRGDSIADRAAQHILKAAEVDHKVIPFAVGGSDERQYCSPGFNLPVGSVTRSMYRNYKEYHTSLDNKDFISFEAMTKTVEIYVQIAQALELNDYYVNLIPHCEPQLGKRDMYPSTAGWLNGTEYLYNLLHFLSYADGTVDLLEIAEKRSQSILAFTEVIANSRKGGLIE